MANSTPSFSKIMFIRSSSNLLQLPPSFVTKHLGNKIPTNPIVRSANGGYVWKVKIDKIDNGHFFTNGWPDVVRDAELRFGHFLLFELVDETTFKMFVYNPDGCEKILNPNPLVYDHVMEDDHVVVIDDDVDDDIDVVDVDDDDDDDVDVHDVDDDDGKDDGTDPMFKSIISNTHNTKLRLPTEFVKLAKIEDKKSIIMKNSTGIEWEMGIRLDYSNVTTRYHLSTSWCDFRRFNKLSIGDECVFKFIKSEKKMCLAHVTKKHEIVKMTSRCDKCGVERKDERTEVVRRGRPPKPMHLPRQQ